MTTIPSLSGHGRGAKIPPQTFTDLQCAKLFSAHTRMRLSDPCDPKNLIRRQETFRALTRERCEQLREILPILDGIRHRAQLLSRTESKTEAVFLRCSLLEHLLQAMDQFCTYREFGPCFQDAAEALSSAEATAQRNLLHDAVREARTLLNRISRFDLANGITAAEEDRKSCNDLLKAYAERIECNISKTKQKTIPLKPESDFFYVFEEDILRAEQLLSPFLSVDTTSFTDRQEEILFFLEIWELCNEGAAKGIPTCLPRLCETAEFTATDLYDITLLRKEPCIVANDSYITKEEPFFFLTGANGGGKTTYLRAVGCNLILALAGCPVFAKQASVYPFTTVLTHFPEDERFERGGRLENE